MADQLHTTALCVPGSLSEVQKGDDTLKPCACHAQLHASLIDWISDVRSQEYTDLHVYSTEKLVICIHLSVHGPSTSWHVAHCQALNNSTFVYKSVTQQKPLHSTTLQLAAHLCKTCSYKLICIHPWSRETGHMLWSRSSRLDVTC